MQPLIEIRNLIKSYGSNANAVHALRGVNLDVHAGEVLLLSGPSGSGKTTLLSIMGAILAASSGSVRVQGQQLVGLRENELPAVRRNNFGFVFQGFNLFPALSALENVELALDVKKGKRETAAELLASVGLKDKLNTYPADLSGGQKQRVAIARALAADPPIVLADEPTAALDSTSGKAVMEILHSLAKQRGRAVVVVTHDSRILHYADRRINIEDGLATLIEDGFATSN
jgi:putative ABC transport system ATP-binding protein